MSHRVIAAVLAGHDLSSGERLAAFSLASFAGPRQPCTARHAGGGGESRIEAELVP